MIELQTIIRNGREYRIHREFMRDPLDPREFYEGHIGQMLIWHSKYKLGDPHKWSSPQEFVNAIEGEEDVDYVLFNIYAYEHGDISLSLRRTGVYADKWDSYQCGYFYFRKEDVIKKTMDASLPRELKEDKDYWKDHAYKLAEQDLDIYNQYLGGDVYSSYIEEVTYRDIYIKNGDNYEFLRKEEVVEEVNAGGEFYSEQEIDRWIEESLEWYENQK